MITRSHRFHGYNSLRFVYRNGQMVRGPLFAVKYVLNPKRKSYRLAVVVSRKVHKSAVARNRIRRRLYETVRQLEVAITEPYDIVLTVFHGSLLEEPHPSLAKQVKKQLSQAGVLSKHLQPRPEDRT
ncbi:MAG: ribonuclease P protein component [Candidatus Saccharimonadales bacterium]